MSTIYKNVNILDGTKTKDYVSQVKNYQEEAGKGITLIYKDKNILFENICENFKKNPKPVKNLVRDLLK